MIINNKKYKNIIIGDGTNTKEIIDKDNIYHQDILSQLHRKYQKEPFDLVLFGTGKFYSKLPEDFEGFFIKYKIKYEIMVSSSAYNTYNILVSEDRNFFSIIKLL